MIGDRLKIARGLLLTILLLCGAGGLQAQSSRLENTPVLIQDGFGTDGQNLPNDGLMYCCPTATTMGLYWLSANGYTALAPIYDPQNPDLAAAQNLDQVIAGLIGTSPGGGTKNGAVPGLHMYFGLKGYSSTATVVETGFPTSAEINNAVSGTSQAAFDTSVLSVGWYDDQTWVKNGGHCLALLNFGAGTGGGSLGTVTINNPMRGQEGPQIYAMSDYVNVPPDLANHYYLQPSLLSNSGTTVPVLQGMFTFNPGRAAGLTTVDAYDFSSEGLINIDTNGGILTAPAQLIGTGAVVKNGAGILVLETDSIEGNTFSGGLTVNQGSVVATQNSGTAIGTGNVQLNGGSLVFNPSGSGGDLVLNLSGAGSLVNYTGGTIGLNQGSYDSLTVVLGGMADGTTANLQGAPVGSLILAAAGGLGSLGNTEKILVNGSGGNLPVLTNGMVSGSIVGQDNNADLSGDFLAYTPTDGFLSFSAYVSSSVTALGPGTNQNTVYENTTDQAVASNTSAAVYALKVTDSTISGGGGSSLSLGQMGAGASAGVILNGGEITVSALDFSDNTAVIYVNGVGGQIGSAIAGSGGVVVQGPGSLRLFGGNTYTGNTLINSGTLVSLSSSATGLGDVTVAAEGTLAGTGVVQGNLFVSGTIAPGDPESGSTIGTLTVDGNLIFDDGSVYLWELGSLTESGSPGTNWDYLQMNGDLDIPNFALNFFSQVTLQFNSVSDPDSGNSFWDQDRQWEIATFTGSINSTFEAHETSLGISNPRWGDYGKFSLELDGKNILLIYSVPEPSTKIGLLCGLLTLGVIWALRKRSEAASATKVDLIHL